MQHLRQQDRGTIPGKNQRYGSEETRLQQAIPGLFRMPEEVCKQGRAAEEFMICPCGPVAKAAAS